MNTAAETQPLVDFKDFCKLVGLGKDTVRKHLKSTDPAQYWPHLRIGSGPKARIKFTQAQIAQIFAKLENPGPAGSESVLVTTVDFDRSVARLRRDRRQVA
jgi:hypothetical protein